jgi:enamine deaminase RidA (YjgF/YER057c/UK114 family)
MKTILAVVVAASLAVLAWSNSASAQVAAGPEARLKALNITLPPDTAPIANFVNSVQTGKLLFLSGNTAGPAWAGKGKLGKDLTVEQGREAARQAGLIMLTKIRTALGSLDRVKRVVKVLGMVNSAEGFGDQPLVVNGFSADGGGVRRGWQACALRRRHGGASRQLAGRSGDDRGIRVSEPRTKPGAHASAGGGH